MIFGIILIAIGALVLLKAFGLIDGVTWDYIIAVVLIAIGISWIAKKR